MKRTVATAAVAGFAVAATACGASSSNSSFVEGLEELPWLSEDSEELPYALTAVDYEAFTEAWGEEFPSPEGELSREDLEPFMAEDNEGLYVPTTQYHGMSISRLQTFEEQREDYGHTAWDVYAFVDYAALHGEVTRVEADVDEADISEWTGVDPEDDTWELPTTTLTSSNGHLVVGDNDLDFSEDALSVAEQFPDAVELADLIDDLPWYHAQVAPRHSEHPEGVDFQWVGVAIEAEFNDDGDYDTDLVTLFYLAADEETAEANISVVREIAESETYEDHFEVLEVESDGDITTLQMRSTSDMSSAFALGIYPMSRGFNEFTLFH